jgi:hypothetical protein
VENNIGRNKVRSVIFEIINRMSEQEMHELLNYLEKGELGERRLCDRKDFLRVIPEFCTQIVSVNYVRQFFVMPPSYSHH